MSKEKDLQQAKWKCPPLQHLEAMEFSGAPPLIAQIARAGFSGLEPAAAFGGELRAAYVLLSDCTGRFSADNDFCRAKLRALMLRPAVEPIVLSYWDRWGDSNFSSQFVLNFGSALCGKVMVFRDARMFGTSGGLRVEFESASELRGWIHDLNDCIARPIPILSKISYCFARSIFAHALVDGNGRFSRCILYFILSELLGKHSLAIPLAPAFYINAKKVGDALGNLSESQNWRPFCDTIYGVIEDGIGLSNIIYSMEEASLDQEFQKNARHIT